MTRRIAPSILAADFGRLREEVTAVIDAGATVIHVDVMDGHFVPPITMGPNVVEALRDLGAHLDVHLMIERPERQIADFAKAGAGTITIHAESTPHIDYVARAHPRRRMPRRRSPSTRPRRSTSSARSTSTRRSA